MKPRTLFSCHRKRTVAWVGVEIRERFSLCEFHTSPQKRRGINECLLSVESYYSLMCLYIAYVRSLVILILFIANWGSIKFSGGHPSYRSKRTQQQFKPRSVWCQSSTFLHSPTSYVIWYTVSSCQLCVTGILSCVRFTTERKLISASICLRSATWITHKKRESVVPSGCLCLPGTVLGTPGQKVGSAPFTYYSSYRFMKWF